MDKENMVKNLVKLQILCLRYVERNTNLRCCTHRDMDRIIMKSKLTCTYEEAAENLYENIKRYCKDNKYLNEECLNLKNNIEGSSIKNLRFGLNPQRKFTEEEKELDDLMLKRKFFMINEMVGIKELCSILGLTESAVKQACQQERLLNTKKTGKAWMVHIPECRAYWNIKDEEERDLYKEYVY